MGLQKTSHDCATELNWSEILSSSAKSGMVLDWSLSTLGSGFLGWCCPGSWLAIMLLPPASGSSFSVRNNLCLQPSAFLSSLPTWSVRGPAPLVQIEIPFAGTTCSVNFWGFPAFECPRNWILWHPTRGPCKTVLKTCLSVQRLLLLWDCILELLRKSLL